MSKNNTILDPCQEDKDEISKSHELQSVDSLSECNFELENLKKMYTMRE